MTDRQWTPKQFFQLVSQSWELCALQAAVKLDIFTALDEAPGQTSNVTALAAGLGSNLRATNMLVTALTSMGLLERDGEEVWLTEDSKRYLSRQSPDYYGFFIKHSAHILPGWTRLDKAVRSGRSVAETVPEGDEESQREAFLMGMFNVARQQADTVASAFDLTGRKNLLDLGGGPGTYAVHFCLHNEGLKATVFDQPGSEKFVLNTAGRFGLSERIGFIGGDFLSTPLPSGYDVIWLSQVLHGENPLDAARLIKLATEALAPGGLLGIQEFIIDNDLKGPAHSALFSLNMLVQTQGGQSYTEKELIDMLQSAGLSKPVRIKADLPPGCGILTAVKDHSLNN